MVGAGWPALAHDGPLVDVVGLGTPSLTRAFRHGPGAVVEALARRVDRPQIAALNLDLLPLRHLLGEPLLAPPIDPRRQTVIYDVRADPDERENLSPDGGEILEKMRVEKRPHDLDALRQTHRSDDGFLPSRMESADEAGAGVEGTDRALQGLFDQLFL